MESTYDIIMEVLGELAEEQAVESYDSTEEFVSYTNANDKPFRWEYQHESCTSHNTRFKKRNSD